RRVVRRVERRAERRRARGEGRLRVHRRRAGLDDAGRDAPSRRQPHHLSPRLRRGFFLPGARASAHHRPHRIPQGRTAVPEGLKQHEVLDPIRTFPENPPETQSPTGVAMNLAKTFIVAAIFAATFSAQAAGVGARVGTTGVGGDVGFNVAPTLDARVGYSYFRYKTHYNSDINYDAKFQLSNLNGLLDWSPF